MGMGGSLPSSMPPPVSRTTLGGPGFGAGAWELGRGLLWIYSRGMGRSRQGERYTPGCQVQRRITSIVWRCSAPPGPHAYAHAQARPRPRVPVRGWGAHGRPDRGPGGLHHLYYRVPGGSRADPLP